MGNTLDEQPLTVDAKEAARLLGYRPEMIRKLYRSGRFPAPIDAELPVRLWRWPRHLVVKYAGAS